MALNNQEISCASFGQQSKKYKCLRRHVGLSGLMCTTALIVMGTTVIAQEATRTAPIPTWNTEPFAVTAPLGSDISQIDGAAGYTNFLKIDSIGTLAIVNGVTQDGVKSAVQDAAVGSNSLNITTNSFHDSPPNYVFVSQLGDVTQTLTINGAGNKVYLVDFGGKDTATEDTIVLNGDSNIMTLTTTALSAAHQSMDVDVDGAYSTIYVSNDEYSKLVLWVNGFSDHVSVVQSNDGVTEQYSATAILFNEANVDISGAAGGNVVSITQTGTDNVLNFDLVGDGNNIDVNQVNNGVGQNKLTVDLVDDNVDLVINASGAGTNAFTVNGSGNNLTISSDSIDTGLSSDNAEANITVHGTDNTVKSLGYTDVTISLGQEVGLVSGNNVATTGNANVAIFSEYNNVDFENSSGFDSPLMPSIRIGEFETGGNSNSIAAYNKNSLGYQQTYSLSIDGTENIYALDTMELAKVDVTINGDFNSVSGSHYGTNSDLGLYLAGNSNIIFFDELNSPEPEELIISVSGDENSLSLKSTANEVYSSYLNVTGNNNVFSYDLLASVDHETVGSDFGATFTAAATSGGRAYYNVSMNNFGTGFTKFTTGASSMVITGDCSYSENVNGDGACL